MISRRGFVAAAGLAATLPAHAADDAPWAALRSGGHVLLLRHAETTPGVGDPPGFRLVDCATQRNLSDQGRTQAQAIGRALAERGVSIGPVLASRWCRCLDTARLAFGRVEPWPPLDSFFADRAAEVTRSNAVRDRIARWQGPETLVLVTHQVNITALTGEVTAPGEALVLEPAARNGFSRVGRVRF